MKKRLYILALLLLLPIALAAGNEAYDPLGVWKVLGIGTAIVALFCIIATCFAEHMSEGRKKALFIILVIGVVAATGYFVVSTVMLNYASSTSGPIHWHADFQIYNCGERVDIIDPNGLSNKVGSPVFHEHDDDRIHVEGPVLLLEDVSLAEFFAVLGGALTENKMTVPTNEGVLNVQNGGSCNGEPATLQVFLLRVNNPKDHNAWTYTQNKLSDFTNYVLSPYSAVPPGDCFIVEYGPERAATDHLCETYDVAMKRGDLRGD